MRRLAGLWALLWLFPGLDAPARAGERELGAHRHGHGTVNMVIEGSTIWIELEAPGADIVGFEHAAESAEDRATVEAAKALLGRPLELFDLPGVAGCSVESVAVGLAGEEGRGTEARGGGHTHEKDGGEGHSEFHAEYRLGCADAAGIDRVAFSYFTHFPAALGLEVNVVTAARQSRHEVGRDDAVVRLGDD